MAVICPKCKSQYDITLFEFGRTLKCDGGYELNPGKQNPVEIFIDGILDLHTFRPEELKDLVPGYLEACRRRGILSVRIIHGKGTGALKRTVHSLLAKIRWVDSFHPAAEEEGGWGATVVYLNPNTKRNL